jgi:Protein of unknown function (DUF2281)
MVHVKRLLQTLETLPAELQQEVVDFAEFLAQRRAAGGAQWQEKISAEELIQRRREGFGRFKGVFTVPDDFDAPLDDFKEYM